MHLLPFQRLNFKGSSRQNFLLQFPFCSILCGMYAGKGLSLWLHSLPTHPLFLMSHTCVLAL